MQHIESTSPPGCGSIAGVGASKRAASRKGLIVFSLALSCGGRSDLGGVAPSASSTCLEPPSAGVAPSGSSTCPEPPSAVPHPGSLELPGSTYEIFQIAFHNRCAQTIWPAWVHSGGYDVSVTDPSFWAPIEAGQCHVTDMYHGSVVEVAFWGRTRCSFDDQGNGSCETGDCGQFVCATWKQPPDATVYDTWYGFAGGYNVPMAVETPGCDARDCRFELGECEEGARKEGACGVAACTAICPSSSPCCHEYSNGCSMGADIDITFCP
jgi:hypothetical protein